MRLKFIVSLLLSLWFVTGIGCAATAEAYNWRQVEIVGSGFVPGIVFHPTQPNLMYCRTDIGGAYRWDSVQKRWIALQDWVSADDWNLLGVESIGLDPSDANVVYLAAGTYTNDWAGNGAILRSRDQGKNWQRTNLPFKLGGNEDGRSMGERLVVDPHDGRILFLGTRSNGLWKSTDSGANWQQVTTFPNTDDTKNIGVGFIFFDARDGKIGAPTPTLYAGVASPTTHLYRSKDGGTSWQKVPGQPNGLLPHHGVLAADGTLYLSYGDKPGPNGMSDGAVWKLDTKTDQWTNITPIAPGGDNTNFGYAGLAVTAKNPNIVMVATMDRWGKGDDIFRSTNGGKSWTGLRALAERDSSLSPFLKWGRDKAEFGHWIGDVEIDPFNSNHAMYVTGATIWGTQDLINADQNQPTHWTVHARGIEETAVIDLISPPSGPHLISGLGDIGGFRHDDLGASPQSGMWTNPTMNNVTALDFAELNPNIVVRVGTAGKGEKRGAVSVDGAISWTPFASEPTSARDVDARSRSVAVSADGASFVWVAPDNFAHFSRDKGVTWTRCKGLEANCDVVADRVNPQGFYALDGKAGKLYFSTDGGASFTAREATLPKTARRLRAVPEHQGDLWLAAGDEGLWHSTDGGANWQKVTSVQTTDTIGFGKAAPDKNYPALYIAGKANEIYGVYRSDDSGATWTRINDDAHRYGWIGRAVIGDPRVYGRVFVATNGRGIAYGEPIPMLP